MKVNYLFTKQGLDRFKVIKALHDEQKLAQAINHFVNEENVHDPSDKENDQLLEYDDVNQVDKPKANLIDLDN